MNTNFDPDFDTDDAIMHRELTEYGETIGKTAFALVWDYSMCTLPTDQSAKVRMIIELAYNDITDSLLDDILDDLSPEV